MVVEQFKDRLDLAYTDSVWFLNLIRNKCADEGLVSHQRGHLGT